MRNGHSAHVAGPDDVRRRLRMSASVTVLADHEPAGASRWRAQRAAYDDVGGLRCARARLHREVRRARGRPAATRSLEPREQTTRWRTSCASAERRFRALNARYDEAILGDAASVTAEMEATALVPGDKARFLMASADANARC